MEITVSYSSLVFGATLLFFCGALFSLVGVGLGGLLVLRARGNGYEPIIPPMRDRDEEAVNLDDFSEHEQEEPEDMDQQIERILSQRAAEDPEMEAVRRKKHRFDHAAQDIEAINQRLKDQMAKSDPEDDQPGAGKGKGGDNG